MATDETISKKFCFLIWFLSQVILIALWLSFQTRYSRGVYNFRKKCCMGFSGDTCPNSIVYSKDQYFGLQWLKRVGKKILRKKPILLVNFCFLSHFDFSKTRIVFFLMEVRSWTPTCCCTKGEHVDLWDILTRCINFYSHSLIFTVILPSLLVYNLLMVQKLQVFASTGLSMTSESHAIHCNNR